MCKAQRSWDAICSPRRCPLLILPSLFLHLSHCSSFNCNLRTVRAGGKEKTHNGAHKTRYLDGQTATHGRCCLPGRSYRMLASPRGARRSDGPRNGWPCQLGCSKTPGMLGRRSYEAGGGAAPVISPPFHLQILLHGPAAGTEVVEGRLRWGCHPTCFW